MINPIQISRDVVIAPDEMSTSGRAALVYASVAGVNQDASWPRRQSPNADSVDVQGLYGVLSSSKDAVNRIAAEIRGLG